MCLSILQFLQQHIEKSENDPLRPIIKESPALAAEKVIKENMTDEQRKLEYE